VAPPVHLHPTHPYGVTLPSTPTSLPLPNTTTSLPVPHPTLPITTASPILYQSPRRHHNLTLGYGPARLLDDAHSHSLSLSRRLSTTFLLPSSRLHQIASPKKRHLISKLDHIRPLTTDVEPSRRAAIFCIRPVAIATCRHVCVPSCLCPVAIRRHVVVYVPVATSAMLLPSSLTL
jgi:hypothetical protein